MSREILKQLSCSCNVMPATKAAVKSPDNTGHMDQSEPVEP
jgi:hypothetical protein